MKDILKNLGSFAVAALKELDWKTVLYKACKDTVLPMIKKLIDNPNSKIDDVIYAGLEKLVEAYLGPDKPTLPAPAKAA